MSLAMTLEQPPCSMRDNL